MDEKDKKNIEERLKMFLKDDNLVAEYIQVFGYDINMKKVNDLKQQEIVLFDERESPMYKISVTCPICKTKIDAYELKAKSLIIKENKFKVPFYYDGANYESVDFNRYRVTVCPKCLFASPDKKDFNRVNSFSKKDEYSQIHKNILHAIDENINSRILLVNNSKKIIKSFGDYPRAVSTAVYSYKLAILRSIQEEKHMFQNAHLKHGGYILRLIKLSKEMGESSEELMALYVEAFHVFEKGYELANFSSKDLEFYNLYLLIATLLYIGRKDEAINYNAQIPKLIEECGYDKKILKESIKWENSIKDLFEYFDEVESWDTPRS